MGKKRCRYFEECNAPLCPNDESSAAHCSWFPGEEICRLQQHPAWVTRQHKIARKLPHDMESGCFTVRMLQRNCVMGSDFAGVDPDKGPAHEQEDVWLKKHPEYVPTEEHRERGKKLAAAYKK